MGELLDWTTERFADLGIDEARTDAQHLLSFALGCSRMDLYLRHNELVESDRRARFRDLVKRRLAREPVAYIEGRRGFHALDLDLKVDRRVLVPRPDTELLVDWVLESLRPAPAPVARILDVGTGSGAIALALSRARDDVRVWASDISEEALSVARSNAQGAALEVEFVQADLGEGVPVPEGGFDVVVANLPYIPSADLDGLQPEVRDYEPRLALDGGPDGLDLVRRLVEQSEGLLGARGQLFLEFGIGQAPAVRELLQAAGFTVELRDDLGGVTRAARATRG